LKKGVAQRDHGWIPDVGRYLPKLGCYAAPNITKESIVARSLALSCAYKGRNQPMAEAFLQTAERHAAGADLESTYHYGPFDEVGAWYGKGEAGHVALGNMIRDVKHMVRDCAYPSTEEQRNMVCLSLFEDDSPSRLSPGGYANFVGVMNNMRSYDVADTPEVVMRLAELLGK